MAKLTPEQLAEIERAKAKVIPGLDILSGRWIPQDPQGSSATTTRDK